MLTLTPGEHFWDTTILAREDLKAFSEKESVAKYKRRYSTKLQDNFKNYKIKSTKELEKLINELKSHHAQLGKVIKERVETKDQLVQSVEKYITPEELEEKDKEIQVMYALLKENPDLDKIYMQHKQFTLLLKKLK